MQYRPARESDFAHLETFVWQAIFPAFGVEGLTEAQRAENDGMVEGARSLGQGALADPHRAVFVAVDERRGTLMGYVIADAAPRAYAEVVQIVVKRSAWGQGVAAELLNRALDFIGRDRAVQLAVRNFNERALAFFAKHGFENTGEQAGEFAIPRILLLREAFAGKETEDFAPNPTEEAEARDLFSQPVFEALPSHQLAADDLTDTAPPPPEESTLSENQLTELQAFISKARAKKKTQFPDIEFEVDFGGRQEKITSEPESEPLPPEPDTKIPEPEILTTPTFEFAFDERPEAKTEDPELATKTCANCATILPEAARFCFSCGQAQFADPVTSAPESPSEPETASETVEDDIDEAFLILEDIPEPEAITQADFEPRDEPAPYTFSGIRSEFDAYLEGRLVAYFGPRAARPYRERYAQAEDFRTIRDNSLHNFIGWANGRRSAEVLRWRLRDTIADLTEFFIVETCADLHGRVFPQSLLRYQSTDWHTVDLFKLVTDYLDLDNESERVYTDFITMPKRVLKSATERFLRATRDERIFLICDQSLMGSGKYGFALTDTALYWKNMLQPAGAVNFGELASIESVDNHLLLDKQFFDAGSRLNMKIALLLDKLARRAV